MKPIRYATFLGIGLLAGCASIHDQPPPPAPMQPAYKEAPPGWVTAAPADVLDRGPWWTLFDDPTLNALADKVQISNQNIAAAVAAVAQAQALVREQRSTLFPQVGLSAGATRSGGSSTSNTTTTAAGSVTTSVSSAASRYSVNLNATWEPDLWGRLRGEVSAAGDLAQASAADLANARLSAIGTLAVDYFSLRETDAEIALLRDTVTAYQRALTITTNRYNAAIAVKTDVLQAQTQLANAQASLAGLGQQRATLEHAIAVLTGTPPGNFSLPAAPWKFDVLPAVPLGLPSTLLQRRPDVAAAERRLAAANIDIGVARTGYFPDIGLTASGGTSASRIGDLFSTNVWSLGLSLAQVVFDAGAIHAQVDEARAAWEQSVANYRQAVLVALQNVEDELATTRVLEQQYAFRQVASQAADLTEQQVFNRYNAAQLSYSDVVTAQVTALAARQSLVQLVANRQEAAVQLIQALGGGWQAGEIARAATVAPASPASSSAASGSQEFVADDGLHGTSAVLTNDAAIGDSALPARPASSPSRSSAP